MTARDGINIASLVLSVLLLASGITLSVLVYEIVRQSVKDVIQEVKSADHDNGNMYSGSSVNQVTNSAFNLAGPFWLIGLGFIVPGICGLIASISRNKCAYINHLVFGIISLLVMGILFIIGVILLGTIATHHSMDCKSIDDTCWCRADQYEEYQNLRLKSCDLMFTVYNLGLAIVIVIVITWILLLVEVILCGIKTCSSGNGSSGSVIIRAPVTTNFVRLDEVPVGPPVYTHDQAGLVQNA